MYKEGTNPILSHSAAAADTNISLSTSNANNTNTTNDQSSDSLGYITTAASSQIPAIDQSSSELIHKPIAQGNQDSDSEVEVVAVTQDPSFGTSQHHQHGTQQQQQQQPNRHAQYARSADQPVGQPEASSRPVQHQQQYHAANDTSSATNISQHQHSHQNQQQQHQQQNQQHQQPTKKYQMYKPYVIAHTSFDLFKGHEPTWEYIWPKMKVANPAPILKTTNQVRAYKLSLLSNTECTITAVLHHTNTFDYQPSLMGMRKPIKEITRLHSKEGEKAVLEEGRWRIPLSVYQVFYSYLCNQSGTVVEKIPQAQLNIATLGRAVAERGYPSAEELTDRGIPIGLANALAPYQRGGVDFVLQRNGKALIADEMGLGKTVQGIAAMACFSNEWPVLILSPSSARYHWEAEFLNWLGKDSDINAAKPMGEEDLGSDDLHLDDLEDFIGDINNWEEQKADVSDIFNINNIKRKQTDGNKPKSKKMKPATMKLLDPSEVNVLTSSSDTILKSNTRVVIVSYGLIANLTKKHLLVPNQFKCIIVDESHMLKNKNSKRTLSVMPLLKKAERVVMLSGTPALAKPEDLFPQLNALGEGAGWWNDEEEFRSKYVKDKYSDPSFAELHTLLTSTVMIRRMKNDILKDMPSKMRENVHINVRDPILGQTIKDGLLTLRQGKGVLGKLSLLHQNLDSIENRIQPPPTSNGFDGFHQNNVPKDTEDGYVDGGSRKAILNKIFRLSGTAKIPALVDMLKRWLSNPENGKLCIFAHHINVLDALVRLGGLSNALRSTTKYIRIDGSTNPKFRQEQITSFQNDPTVKIAVLGITAAGVGVTLTAASTIWFAELFWTPALMIQAEDR
jgi:SWI/SNF-related matrix-associated actin-dependent regulator 1 of chromatin subfamily A